MCPNDIEIIVKRRFRCSPIDVLYVERLKYSSRCAKASGPGRSQLALVMFSRSNPSCGLALACVRMLLGCETGPVDGGRGGSVWLPCILPFDCCCCYMVWVEGAEELVGLRRGLRELTGEQVAGVGKADTGAGGGARCGGSMWGSGGMREIHYESLSQA